MNKLCQFYFTVLFLALCLNVNAAGEPSLDEIMQKAKQGDSLAQAKIGSIYYLGENVDLGPKARFKAKSRLKQISYLLQGIEKNDKVAAAWLEKAAKQGLMEAEIFMAALFDSGVGVSLDVRQATKWYEKARAAGNGTAKAILGEYKGKRIQASKEIPMTYALEILAKK